MAAPMSVTAAMALAMHVAPGVAPDTLVAFAKHESGLHPYAIGDNTAARSYFPDTASEAVAIASTLLSAGHSLDMGLLQLNSQHLGRILPDVKTAFDPAQSMRLGAIILKDAYRACDGDDARTSAQVEVALRCAAARYNTGKNGPVGQAYAAKIWRVAETFVPSISEVMKKKDFPNAALTNLSAPTEPRRKSPGANEVDRQEPRNVYAKKAGASRELVFTTR